MNGNGYCSECGKYAQTLGHLPDGTEVYRCYECGHMWAERLVVFDVSFALAEHKVDGNGLEGVQAVLIPAPSTL